MRPLILLWGCLVLPGYGALTGPTKIRGFEGDTMSIQCSYGEKLRNHWKYWCRKTGIIVARCSDTVYAHAGGQESTKGRVSIQDSPQELRFNVTLRELTLKDSGEYWCGIRILGFDETLLVSLIVLPEPVGLPLMTGPCCSPSPTSFLQPLATRLQPKAKAWQTQPPALRISGPSTRLDSASAKYTSLLPSSSSSSKSRVCPTTVRILAPVLVLLALLLASGLCALGRYMLRWRKKVPLAMETQKNEKVHHSHLPLRKGQVRDNTVIKRVQAHTGPAASPCTEIRCLHQTSEQEEAPLQDPESEARPGPPLHMSEELRRSVFIPV